MFRNSFSRSYSSTSVPGTKGLKQSRRSSNSGPLAKDSHSHLLNAMKAKQEK